MSSNWRWVLSGTFISLFIGSACWAAEEGSTAAKAGMHKKVEVRQLNKLDAGEVYGNDGKKVGHIKGLAIDTVAGRIAYAVIEFDRLADIGDKQFAVPWAALDKKIDEQKYSRVTYAMNADREQLKNAKGIDKSNWPGIAQLKMEDSQALWNVKPYWTRDHSVSVRAGNTQVDVDVKKQATDNARLQGTPVSTDEGIIVKATDLEGHRVMDQSGNDVAKLAYVMADAHSGRLVYGILELDKMSDLNPVPFPILQITSTGKDLEKNGVAQDGKAFKIVVTQTVDKVKEGPKFSKREWPDMTPQWGDSVYSVYGVKPFWAKHVGHTQ